LTGSPGDHPAVVNPQAVTGNQQVLSAPVLAAPAIVGQQATPAPNNLMSLLRDLFPNGSMNQVVIKNMKHNKNPIATATMGGFQYGAWTQSGSLVFARDDFYNSYDIVTAYILRHEAEHIMQFRNSSTGPPKTFAEMLTFEVGAYSRTYEWIKSPLGKKDLIAAGFDPLNSEKEEYERIVEIARGAANGVRWHALTALARRTGQVIARTVSGVFEAFSGGTVAPANPLQNAAEFYFESMVANEAIPQPMTLLDSNGNIILDTQNKPVPIRYTAPDMYLQPTNPSFVPRMKALRFPI
jgi:hypothetical protein